MPDRRSIDTLFLDAGGVLVVPNWRRVSETFARHGVHVGTDALRQAEPAVKFAVDQAVGAAASSDARRSVDYFEGILGAAGVPLSAGREAALAELRAYHRESNLWEDVPDDVVPALERLRAAGLTIAVASNANGTVARCFGRIGLGGYFQTICDSHFEGVEKPDPRFFTRLLERTGARPERTLHVGDLFHVDVVGARRAGLRAMLLDRDDLYGAFDAERIHTLEALADRLA